MKVTVVTPSFNQAEFLERTLLSVFRQEDADFEYIVVDGQSTDGSVDILESHRDKIQHLKGSGQEEETTFLAFGKVPPGRSYLLSLPLRRSNLSIN